MKILVISADFPPWDGGIAQVGYEYARTFCDLGHQVTVLAPHYRNCTDWDSAQPFKIVRYRTHNAFIIHFWLLRIALSRLFDRQAFDWVLSMRWNLDGIAFNGRHRTTSIFQWFHGNELFDRHLNQPRWAARLNTLMESAGINIAISHYTADLIARHFPSCPRVRTVHLGIDSQRFRPPKSVEAAKAALGWQGKRVILSLSRLVKRKGHELVIKSLAHTGGLNNTIYVIAGKGSYESTLRQMVAQAGLQNQVHFAGFVSEKQKVLYYQACDIYVMPSRSEEKRGDVEGFGLTYLEANACGKPVIGGRQGGCMEAIDEGVSGLLVDPDKEAEMAQALKRLLLDAGFYEQLSRKGLERVRQSFSWEASCQKLLALHASARPWRMNY